MPSPRKKQNKATSKKKKIKKTVRKPRDKNAPAKPLSSYHFFYRSRHSAIPRNEKSGVNGDISRQIANEWYALKDDKKQEYIALAAADRGRYVKEFDEYKKTDAYKNYQKVLKKHEREVRQGSMKDTDPEIDEWMNRSKRYKRKNGDGNATNEQKDWAPPPDSIPIFSESFLEHNREREAVLRRLRKQLIESEEENALLSKHVETLTTAKDSLQQAVGERTELCSRLVKEFDSLKFRLADALSSVSLPARLFEDCVPDQNSVISYLTAVSGLMDAESSDENKRILERVSDALSKALDGEVA